MEDVFDIQLDLEEDIFSTLSTQVVRHNVIPLIGNKFSRIDSGTSKEFIIKAIAKSCGIKEPISSYDQLHSHPLFFQKFKGRLHDVVKSLVTKNPRIFKSDEQGALKKLLSLKNPITNQYCFPFVITTTIDPVVENAMREIHGEVRSLKLRNISGKCDDIKSVSDITTPTIYYIFGSADKDATKSDFVLTDFDYLKFMRTWMLPNDSADGSKPNNFSTLLASKFVLALGCDYQDWLFRFIWYALKQEKGLLETNQGEVGAFSDDDCDENLINFLNSAHTLTHIDDMETFVGKLEESLNNLDVSKYSEFDYPMASPHVFISYSRANSDVAQQLYNTLKEKGVNVWYDKKSLGAGVNFMDQIKRSIESSTLFVPILSKAIYEQAMDIHPYRQEWIWARYKDDNTGGIRFIVPLCEEKFQKDLKSEVAKIPTNILETNIVFYKDENMATDIEAFANQLIEILQKDYGIVI